MAQQGKDKKVHVSFALGFCPHPKWNRKGSITILLAYTPRLISVYALFCDTLLPFSYEWNAPNGLHPSSSYHEMMGNEEWIGRDAASRFLSQSGMYGAHLCSPREMDGWARDALGHCVPRWLQPIDGFSASPKHRGRAKAE